MRPQLRPLAAARPPLPSGSVRLFRVHEVNHFTKAAVFASEERTPERQEMHSAETARLMGEDLKRVLEALVQELFGEGTECRSGQPQAPRRPRRLTRPHAGGWTRTFLLRIRRGSWRFCLTASGSRCWAVA